MRPGVDLASQDLLGARNGELRHLLAQLLLGRLHFLLDLRVGSGHQPLALGLGLDLRLLDAVVGGLLGGGHDFLGAGARLREQLFGLLLGLGERGAAALGFGETRSVRVGRAIELELDATSAADAEARARRMCDKLLANPVTEDYEVEVETLERETV